MRTAVHENINSFLSFSQSCEFIIMQFQSHKVCLYVCHHDKIIKRTLLCNTDIELQDTVVKPMSTVSDKTM